MMKDLAKKLILFCLFLSPLFSVYGITGEIAEAKLCPPGQYVDEAGKCAGAEDTGKLWKDTGAESFIYRAVQGLAGLSFGISALVIIRAAFLYTTDGLSPDHMKRAKTYMISAGVGIFLSMSVFLIVNIIKTSIK